MNTPISEAARAVTRKLYPELCTGLSDDLVEFVNIAHMVQEALDSTQPRGEGDAIILDGTEHVATLGGEAWIDDTLFAQYGLTFGDHSVHSLTPAQAIALVTALTDHLMLCGHRFEIRVTGEQDQRERLVCMDKAL